MREKQLGVKEAMSDDEEDIWKTIEGGEFTHAQIIDILDGDPPRDEEETERIATLTNAMIGKPISEWPPFEIAWDFEPRAQRFALDGCRERDFKEDHPDGLSLVFVTMTDLDAKLTKDNLRTPEEVWSVGDERKAARCLVHWSEGRKLTPPLAVIVGTKIGLWGGNHRLAIARAKGETNIPLLVAPTDKEKLGEIIEFQPAPETIWR